MWLSGHLHVSLVALTGPVRAGRVFVDKTMSVGVVGAIILNQFSYLQNFHLIDYNMLVFIVIILARRLIAAIVKEVRILFLAINIFRMKVLSVTCFCIF